jgi:hypothetical protein
MPASKKKGKGGGKKKKKGAKAAAEKDEIIKLCKSLLKSYQQRCASAESMASPRVCQEIRNSIENETALSKVNLTMCGFLVSLSFSLLMHGSPMIEKLIKSVRCDN